mmetsp:Transcript_4349/g.12735  ORF Transcript_4349/g.12735 Transcript_4349/m.12735 type:complete len:166 (-) Transcript_4349:1548-2045(-)
MKWPMLTDELSTINLKVESSSSEFLQPMMFLFIYPTICFFICFLSSTCYLQRVDVLIFKYFWYWFGKPKQILHHFLIVVVQMPLKDWAAESGTLSFLSKDIKLQLIILRLRIHFKTSALHVDWVGTQLGSQLRAEKTIDSPLGFPRCLSLFLLLAPPPIIAITAK